MLSLTGNKFKSNLLQKKLIDISKDIDFRLNIYIYCILGAFPAHSNPVQMGRMFKAVQTNLLVPRKILLSLHPSLHSYSHSKTLSKHL